MLCDLVSSLHQFTSLAWLTTERETTGSFMRRVSRIPYRPWMSLPAGSCERSIGIAGLFDDANGPDGMAER